MSKCLFTPFKVRSVGYSEEESRRKLSATVQAGQVCCCADASRKRQKAASRQTDASLLLLLVVQSFALSPFSLQSHDQINRSLVAQPDFALASTRTVQLNHIFASRFVKKEDLRRMASLFLARDCWTCFGSEGSQRLTL